MTTPKHYERLRDELAEAIEGFAHNEGPQYWTRALADEVLALVCDRGPFQAGILIAFLQRLNQDPELQRGPKEGEKEPR